MRRIDSSLKRSGAPGLTKRLTYRVWRGDALQIGFGMGASGGGEVGDHQDDIPEVIAFVGNPRATLEDAAIAVETTPQDRNHWTYYPAIPEWRGLFNNWPCISRRASSVLTADDFGSQLEQAAVFIGEVVEHFRGRGYLAR